MIPGALADSAGKLNVCFTDLISSLSALRSLSSLNLRVENEQMLIRNALRALIQNQDMERCSVFMLHDDHLVNITGLDWEDLHNDDNPALRPERGTVRFSLGEGLIGKAALSRSLQHSRNCRDDPRFKSKNSSRKNPPPGSLISAPIQHGSDLLGVLNISHPHTNFFNEWHERLLITYCAMMAHLITNWRFLREMENQVKCRTNELENALCEANSLKTRFETLSLSDELTGLFNRRYFFPQAEAALANAVRYRQPYCILLMDLDHFKKINDEYGHLTGDEVLQTVSSTLGQQVREGDIIARYGGEEFVMVLPNTSFDNGVAFGERIRKAVAGLTWASMNTNICISISIGLSCLDPDFDYKRPISITQLIKIADTALYQAKNKGRNRLLAFHVAENTVACENEQ